MLAKSGGTAMGFPTEFGGLESRRRRRRGVRDARPQRPLAARQGAASSSGSSAAPSMHLGTRKHHEALPAARSPPSSCPGCFAMSERGHGSNVQRGAHDGDLRPRRRRVRRRHARPRSDRKDYIGNAARDGRMAAVFCPARGRRRAAAASTALLVPLRDEDGDVCEGIRIEDGGHEDRAQRRRQRAASGSTTCACRARRCSTATRR